MKCGWARGPFSFGPLERPPSAELDTCGSPSPVTAAACAGTPSWGQHPLSLGQGLVFLILPCMRLTHRNKGARSGWCIKDSQCPRNEMMWNHEAKGSVFRKLISSSSLWGVCYESDASLHTLGSFCRHPGKAKKRAALACPKHRKLPEHPR